MKDLGELYPVGVLARFSKAPTFRACKALIRVLIYLRTTADRGIQFSGTDLNLLGYPDDDWAGDLDSRALDDCLCDICC